MKEATGELSTTVITVVAIAAIAGIFTVWLLPTLRTTIKAKTYCSAAVQCGPCVVDSTGKGKMDCHYYIDNNSNSNTTSGMDISPDIIKCDCTK